VVGIRRREPQLLEDVPHVLLDCVIASASAIAALERLSAISPSTSRARAEIGEWARAAAPWLQASPAAEWKSEAPRQWRGDQAGSLRIDLRLQASCKQWASAAMSPCSA